MPLPTHGDNGKHESWTAIPLSTIPSRLEVALHLTWRRNLIRHTLEINRRTQNTAKRIDQGHICAPAA
jgi:hypothetical protein